MEGSKLDTAALLPLLLLLLLLLYPDGSLEST
jgi:hypothetical protein